MILGVNIISRKASIASINGAGETGVGGGGEGCYELLSGFLGGGAPKKFFKL